MLEPVTIWKRWSDDTKQWEHNHIESGFVPYAQQKPKPKGDFKAQAGWKNQTWLKARGYIVDGKLTKV